MKKLTIPVALLLAIALLTTTAIFASSGAPIAENLEICTYRGVAVGGCLSATDPEGDAVTFQITTEPSKGSIDLDEDGHFVYTPENGKRGKDYFGYRATDSNGNRSQEATVIIRIEKQKSKVTYADLDGASCAYAALRLAEEGVFVGECLGGNYVFSPDAPVSRSEFLAMCLRVTDTDVLQGVSRTGFADDASIAAWAKPYVSTALTNGIISGYSDSPAGAVFAPDQSISVADAAVMLDRAAEFTDAVAAWYAPEDALPVWAVQSAANVSACGLLPYGCHFADETLTRAQAAELLCGAMDLLARR